MSDNKSFLLVEQYRPNTIDECILPVRIKDKIKQFVSKGQIPHLMFYGTAGLGKTSLAYAICNEINADYIYINASSENSIDVVRNKISQFASTASFEGNLKVVILDECLSEHEKVRIGTIDSWVGVPLKDLKRDTVYPVISFNIETGEFENDTAQIISDREDELYEVELENGDKIVANDQHPFMCIDQTGNIVERTIKQGFDGFKVIKSKK